MSRDKGPQCVASPGSDDPFSTLRKKKGLGLLQTLVGPDHFHWCYLRGSRGEEGGREVAGGPLEPSGDGERQTQNCE